MDRLELRLLGVPRVSLDGRVVSLRTRKALALLAFLAVEGGMHRREELAELLWPAGDGRRGRTVLRTTLTGIRRSLNERSTGAGDAFLRVEGDLLGVRSGSGLDLDLDVVRGALTTLRTVAGDGGMNGDLIPTLRATESAYRGEFLEGFRLEDAPDFDLWLEAQRGLWRARIGEVLGRLTELEAGTGELATAARTAERWVAHNPTEKAAVLRLMEARSAAGDPDGALDAYAEYRSELRKLGMDPEPEAEALATRVRALAPEVHAGGRTPAPEALRMPFVGRRAEFEALVEEYRAARAGATRAAFVVGEAGIGKTRLVEEFLAWAEPGGAQTLRGRTFETGARLPYELLVDALRPRIERERAPDDLLEDRWLSALSRILPELRDRYPDLPPPSADEASAQALLFEAVSRLGAALAGGTRRRMSGGQSPEPKEVSGEPLVVFLDDLQWSDGATLDALSYCCRNWVREGVPLLLVMTAREEDLGTAAGLGRCISALGRELPLRRLRLASVGEGDVYGLLRLLAGSISPDNGGVSEDLDPLSRWLWEESGGHPLFLAQILGVLLERGVLEERAGSDGRREIVLPRQGFDEGGLRGLLPAGLRELIRDKLRPLSADASDVLTAGAVLGGPFGFWTILRVAGVGETEGLDALDALVSARLLEETGSPPDETHSFAHEKIREVAYTQAGEARRQVFHRRALGYLEDSGAPAAMLARHALAAGLSEKAFDLLLAAAEEAIAVFAAGDAVELYERARDLLEDPSRPTPAVGDGVSERLRLYGGLAGALILVHDTARAQEACEKMLAAAREAGDREAEWETLNNLSMLGDGAANYGPEDDDLLRGVRRREGLEGGAVTPDIAEKRPEKAGSRAIRSPRVGGGRLAGRYAERALRLARELGREDFVSRSEFALGLSRMWVGLWEESRPCLEEARSLYVKSANRAMEAHCLALLTWCASMAEGPPGAFQGYGRRAIEIRDTLDIDYVRAAVDTTSQWLAARGEYDHALAMGSEGVRVASSLGRAQYVSWNLCGLGDSYREVFAVQQARSTYSKIADWNYFWANEIIFHAKMCTVEALAGEWERARGHALESFELRDIQTLGPNDLHRHYDIEALLRCGDAEVARETLLNFKQRIGTQKGYFSLAYLRAEAVLARWDGDTDRTLALLREALGMAERLGLPGEAWQVGAFLGEVLEERGEIGPSEQTLDRAAAVIRGLAAKISDEDLREGYLAAPQTRRVLEKAETRKA